MATTIPILLSACGVWRGRAGDPGHVDAGRSVFEGKYYQVRGAINQPKGVQQPHIPILIGGGGEKVTLKLVAQYGDACNVFGDLETIKHKFAVLKDHCEAVGRDYESIHRTAGAFCCIGETDEQAWAKFPTALLGRPVAAGRADWHALRRSANAWPSWRRLAFRN